MSGRACLPAPPGARVSLRERTRSAGLAGAGSRRVFCLIRGTVNKTVRRSVPVSVLIVLTAYAFFGSAVLVHSVLPYVSRHAYLIRTFKMFILKSQGIKRKGTHYSTLGAGRPWVFFFFFPVVPPPLFISGGGRFGGGRGFELFFFSYWLLPYLLESAAHICLRSASSPFLDAWGPPPAPPRFQWGSRQEEDAVLCQEGEARVCGEGVWGARHPAFCWISALLPLECWPFRESFMALKVLSWHVPPIPASRVILSPA